VNVSEALDVTISRCRCWWRRRLRNVYHSTMRLLYEFCW